MKLIASLLIALSLYATLAPVANAFDPKEFFEQLERDRR